MLGNANIGVRVIIEYDPSLLDLVKEIKAIAFRISSTCLLMKMSPLSLSNKGFGLIHTPKAELKGRTEEDCPNHQVQIGTFFTRGFTV